MLNPQYIYVGFACKYCPAKKVYFAVICVGSDDQILSFINSRRDPEPGVCLEDKVRFSRTKLIIPIV